MNSFTVILMQLNRFFMRISDRMQLFPTLRPLIKKIIIIMLKDKTTVSF